MKVIPESCRGQLITHLFFIIIDCNDFSAFNQKSMDTLLPNRWDLVRHILLVYISALSWKHINVDVFSFKELLSWPWNK